MTIEEEMQKFSDTEKAKQCKRFFKTGEGEYGEGDKFIGVKVSDQRKIASKHKDICFSDLQKLIDSDIHQYRQTALFILEHKCKKDSKTAYDFYMKNLKNVNNWDLVDCSAPHIVGGYLLDKPRDVLYKLTKGNLWEKRIAMISCFAFIRKNDFKDALKISEMLLEDKHDLIHKAVGWMLREIGKRDVKTEERFLKKYYKKMPRTMLRYAIEKFGEEKRKAYLDKKM